MIGAWIWLAGCGGGANCNADCPENTRRVEGRTSEVVVEGTFWASSDRCDVLCEPSQPCLAPNVPVVTGDGRGSTYDCVPVEGFADLPTPNEVDTSFGESWAEVPDPVAFEVGLDVATVHAFDGDGDGRDDLYTLSGDFLPYAAPAVGFVRSRSGGAFDPVVPASVPDLGGFAASAVTLGDFDGDGWPDWVVARFALADQVEILWLRGTSATTWDPPEVLWSWTYVFPGPVLRTADLNGDGADDLILQGTSGVAFGGPAGPDGARTLQTAFVDLGWGDADGDGLSELVDASPAPTVWWQQPGGAFTPTPVPWEGLAASAAMAHLTDLDGDGRDDLWLRTSAGESGSWISDGAGFRPSPTPPVDAREWSEVIGLTVEGFLRIGQGDFDGDGRQEPLVFTTPFDDGTAPPSKAVMAHGLGPGRLVPVLRELPFRLPDYGFVPVPPRPEALAAIGDFDGDGRDESVWIDPLDRAEDGKAVLGWVSP